MAPTVAFHGQPFDEDRTTGAFLQRALLDDQIESLTVVVAWARFGGLRRIKTELEAFRSRGGTARIILGIDEGVATRPGLVLARESFSEAYVLHDRPGVTFHPKLHLAEGRDRAMLLVGSGNLTAGGLYSNYEAALEVAFELPNEGNAAALVDARVYIAQLLEDQDICLPLTEELVELLVTNPRYAVAGREMRGRAAASQLPAGMRAEDVDPSGERDPLALTVFGTSRHQKVVPPSLPEEARAELRALEVDVEGEDAPEPRPSPASGMSGPPGDGSKAVLVAELSKSRGAEQANIHLEHFQDYFGARKGSRRTITLRQALPGGALDDEERRGSIEVASENYRFELAGLKGHDYPEGDLAPIAVFVKIAAGDFAYRVLWPGEPGFDELRAFVDGEEGRRVGRNRMRQFRTTIVALEQAWSDNPVLAAVR